jgi:hypothetical protein
MLNFFKDKKSSFSCDIEIEGASESKSEARIILEIDNKNYLFYGDIKNGVVDINIPALSFIDAKSGNAKLEIIAENTMFQPFEAEFEIKQQKTVKLDEANIRINTKDEKTVKAVIKEHRVEKPVVKKIIKKQMIKETLTFKKSCLKEDKRFALNVLNKYSKMNKMKKTVLSKMIMKFEPSLAAKKKTESIFEITKSFAAKVVAYHIEKENLKDEN